MDDIVEDASEDEKKENSDDIGNDKLIQRTKAKGKSKAKAAKAGKSMN